MVLKIGGRYILVRCKTAKTSVICQMIHRHLSSAKWKLEWMKFSRLNENIFAAKPRSFPLIAQKACVGLKILTIFTTNAMTLKAAETKSNASSSKIQQQQGKFSHGLEPFRNLFSEVNPFGEVLK